MVAVSAARTAVTNAAMTANTAAPVTTGRKTWPNCKSEHQQGKDRHRGAHAAPLKNRAAATASASLDTFGSQHLGLWRYRH
jgi:hypothetical protein